MVKVNRITVYLFLIPLLIIITLACSPDRPPGTRPLPIGHIPIPDDILTKRAAMPTPTPTPISISTAVPTPAPTLIPATPTQAIPSSTPEPAQVSIPTSTPVRTTLPTKEFPSLPLDPSIPRTSTPVRPESNKWIESASITFSHEQIHYFEEQQQH